MEKANIQEERPDFLRAMFENYFKYAKYNHCKIPFEILVDAIGGGLSGANFPEVNRAELLQALIDSCDIIKTAAKRTLELRQPVSVKEAEEPARERGIREKVFLNLNEVCELFSLPKSNIKYKAWRDKNGFPYIQTADKGRVIFKLEDVENWISQQQNH